MPDTIAIVLNSPYPPTPILEDNVLCADGGYKWVVGTSKKILAVVGDFDSLASMPDTVPKIICPTQKNYSDGERAVRYASEIGAKKVVFYGAEGGRLDMQYSNLSLLKIAYSLHLEGEIVTSNERIFYTEKNFCLSSKKGQRVSILPFGQDAVVTSSKGLLYPLNNLLLTSGDTIGVSNETTDTSFSFTLLQGGVLVFVSL